MHGSKVFELRSSSPFGGLELCSYNGFNGLELCLNLVMSMVLICMAPYQPT
jgi:hypothetical protein